MISSPKRNEKKGTYIMSDGDIIRPPRRAQNTLLHPPGSLTQQPLSSIRQDTKYNFVVMFFVNLSVLVGADGVMVVRLSSSRSNLHAYAMLASFSDGNDFGV